MRRVTTFEGEKIRTYVGKCPHGEVIEKRCGEFNYRVDGKPLGDWTDVLIGPLMLLGNGPPGAALGNIPLYAVEQGRLSARRQERRANRANGSFVV